MTIRRLLMKVAMPLLLLVFSQSLFSQTTKQVTGTVKDKDGAPLAGVSVTLRGGRSGVQTGPDGSFTITVPASAKTLEMSFVGYNSQQIDISNNTVVNVSLEPAAGASLNEVVVVGYGTARKKDLTGSVASVKPKDFNKGIIASPDQAMQGKAAGVMVISNSGQPGGATTVRIRGTASIRTGQQPLYVVDGVPLSGSSSRPNSTGSGIGTTPGTNPLNFLNPNDIASIEILKDASATAIYGSRGANGVVLISTKRGQSGSPVIDVGASAGMSTMMKQLKVLSGDEYRAALSSYGLNGGNFGGSYDAMKEITRTAYTQAYNTAISAGNENSKYRLSLSYLDQQGVVKNSDFKKYTASLNGNFKLLDTRRLNVDYNVMVSGTNEEIPPISNDAGFTGSLIGQALQWNPTHALLKPGTDSAWIDPAVGATTVNPLAMLRAYKAFTNETVILANIAPSYKITKDLEYKLLYSITRRAGNSKGEVKRWININGINGRGTASINNADETSQQFTNTISYNKQVSRDLTINAVVGHEYLKYATKGNGMTAYDFTDAGDLHYWDFMGYTTQGSRQIYSYSAPTTELQSFFGRAMLNFKDRYLLTGTLRADGSTKFGKNNKYGYFPSAAFAWNVTSEEFMKGVSFINNLKLRLGWGKNGNQEFPSGAALRRFVFGQQSVTQQNNENSDLKWETSATTNAGVDFSLWNGKVFGSVDYFYKKTTDVLFEQTVAQPGPLGVKYWINLPGYIVNKGVEVSLGTALVATKDINWNLSVNASFLSNSVQGILGYYQTGGLHGQGISGATSQRIVSNQPLNVFYLAKFEGIEKATGQAIYTGGDPSINGFYVGSPNPKTLLGISTDFQYKKFSAVINMNGAFGHYLYNNTANTVLPIGNLGTRNIAKTLIGGAVKEDPSNPITPSTRYLEKGNYLKMANASIGYYFGRLGKTIKGATVSLTGQNLFVITKFTGFDPEVNTDKQVGGIPSLGIEYTPYPTARTILLGVSFSL